MLTLSQIYALTDEDLRPLGKSFGPGFLHFMDFKQVVSCLLTARVISMTGWGVLKEKKENLIKKRTPLLEKMSTECKKQTNEEFLLVL